MVGVVYFFVKLVVEMLPTQSIAGVLETGEQRVVG